MNPRLAIAALALCLAACGPRPMDPRAQYGANPVLPEPHQYLLPPMSVPPARGWKPGETPQAAAGLQVRPFALGLAHPRMVYTLPNGDVLVVESSGPKAPVYRPKDFIELKIKGQASSPRSPGQRVILLRDANGDGAPELRTVFIDHLNSPFGIVLVGSDLYVAATDSIRHFRYTPGATHLDGPGDKLTDLPAGALNHHWTKALAASPDGARLYVGVGSNSNITENGLAVEDGRAAVWEVDRATGAKREFATGIRNPTGLAFDPTTGALWAVVNERDEIGPDLVPDYLTAVRRGGFYGWPYSYWGQHVDDRVRPQRPDLVAQAIKPDYSLSSHTAPLSLLFSYGGSLPPAYRSGVFIGEHGSWDRSPMNGYKVVYVPFAGGRPSGPPQDVLTGFVAPDRRSKGRPVGVAFDRTGALLVADDVGDAVWRVTAAPAGPAAAPPAR